MGDTRRQLAYGFQLLRMPKLRFQVQHLRYVSSIAMNYMTGYYRKEGPRNRASGQNNFVPQLFQAGGEIFTCNGPGVGRQHIQKIFFAQRLRHLPGSVIGIGESPILGKFQYGIWIDPGKSREFLDGAFS